MDSSHPARVLLLAALTLGATGAEARAEAPCPCSSQGPVEHALAGATHVVLVHPASPSTSRRLSMTSLGDGRSRQEHQLEVRWPLTVASSLVGGLEPDQLINAVYTERSCSVLLGPDGARAPERLAGQAGVCTGSGLELPAEGETGQGGVRIAVLARTSDGFRLLRLGPVTEGPAVTAFLERRGRTLPAAGSRPGQLAAPQLRVLHPDDPVLGELSWLSGAWVELRESGQAEEHWTQPLGGSMLAVHREVKGGETVFTEQIEVGIEEDGRVFYEVHPSFADTPTRYHEVERGAAHVVFANPAHDWPTHLRYQLLESGELEITASGGERVATWRLAPATVRPSQVP